MFNIQKVSKSFVTTKGFSTTALKDVSLKLPQKGLVFILGKSGSGKSTLLNLLGGLDTYDQGDITIKGQSTRLFKQKELDNYRNGTVGFIFQDFYLIETMNVYENIALALELQGKTPKRQVISDLLEQLEMSSFQERKINELSGGQKQRVAIARALVKQPEIILADEPTGNLDSKTSLQVLSILKKLSENHLIVVVSHDQENAYKFGDRVIEFEDGTVISDLTQKNNSTKTKKPQFTKGQVLTEEMIKIIQTQPKNSFKEDFEPTKEILLEHPSTPFQQINSQLPFKKSFKIGASALKSKKILLVFSILMVALVSLLFTEALEGIMFFKDRKVLGEKVMQQKIDEGVKNYYTTFLERDSELTQDEKNKSIQEFKEGLTKNCQKTFDKDMEDTKKEEIILIYVAGVLSLITFFVIYMYFNASIKFKKKEVGTLRALGAKGSTVSKIFFCEGFIYSIIISIIIFLYTFFLFPVMNEDILLVEGQQGILNAFIRLRSWVFLGSNISYIFVLTFLSIIIPITRLSRLKPIDVLLDK